MFTIMAVKRNPDAAFLPFSRNRSRRLTCLLASVILAICLAGQSVWANGIPVQVYLDYLPLKSTWAPASGGKGMAVVSANDEQVQVMLQGMPEPPAGFVYHAWLERIEGGYLSIGALGYRSDGTASLNQSIPGLPYSENFSWVLVALEAAGQVGEAPSGDIALAGRLPNPVALPGVHNDPPQLLPVTGGVDGLAQMVTVWSGVALGVLALGGLAVQFRRRRQPGRVATAVASEARVQDGLREERP